MRSAAAATALGITLTIAGLASCAGPQDPVQPPGPDPSATPVFASDEDALAAAEELYGRYVDISNAIGIAGWGDTSTLLSVARGDALIDEVETAADLHAKGWRQVGESTFDSLVLQQAAISEPGAVDIIVYLCGDVTGVDVVNSAGHSVVSASRPDRQALEVEFDDSEGDLKVNRSDAWTGAEFC